MIYLDNAATTQMDSSVLEEMLPYLTEKFFNPSSIYSKGRNIKNEINNARTKIAKLINSSSEEVYFTSGGTESNNLAIRGSLSYIKDSSPQKKHIICSKIEHHSILNTFKELENQGYEVDYLPCNENGVIPSEILEKTIKKETALVSIMLVNNEIGSVQDIKSIGQICKQHNVIFHSDAVQGLKSEKIDVKEFNIDLLSISSHKIYGPKGVGALYCSKDINLKPILTGGNQENKLRSGTENVAGIMGFGKACEILDEEYDKEFRHLKNLKERFVENLKKVNCPIIINGNLNNTSPSILNISIKDIEAEGFLFLLNNNDVIVSMGSACNSNSIEPSHVISALNLKKGYERGSIRFSFGKYNTLYEIDRVCQIIIDIINNYYK